LFGEETLDFSKIRIDLTHDDGRGGITNLLGFIDDISTVVPLT
jgi:hypothetical protein